MDVSSYITEMWYLIVLFHRHSVLKIKHSGISINTSSRALLDAKPGLI